MENLHFDLSGITDDYLYRRADEYLRLRRLFLSNPNLISVDIKDRHSLAPHPPTHYVVTYHLKGIVGVDEEEKPILGDSHKLKLRLPKEYPLVPAECKMLSDVWHPNIRFHGAAKGSICTNTGGFGTLYYLDELVVRIGEFIQYKRYLAEDVTPYPEDQRVAKWVRDIAEPQGIVNKKRGIILDSSDWIFDFSDPDDDGIVFLDHEPSGDGSSIHREDDPDEPQITFL